MDNPTEQNERKVEDLPLHGIKAVEAAQGVAGPFCGRLLAAFGADVVKVERQPLGDWSRHIGPFLAGDNHAESSALYLYNNTGKKSVLIDWETDAGRDDLVSLVSKADILVEDWDLSYRKTSGLAVDRFAAENPGLIDLCVTPFGLTGPYSGWKSTPIVQMALGGYLSITGEPTEEPLMLPGRQPDYLAGLNAHNAVEIALFQRDMTGVGQLIEVSMIETLANLHQITLEMDGAVRKRNGHRQSALSTRPFPPGLATLPADDGYVTFGGGSPAIWEQLCLMIGSEDFFANSDIDDTTGFAKLLDDMEGLLKTWMKGRTKREIFLEASRDWMLPVAPVQELDEVLADPQYNDRGLFQEIDHPVAGKAVYPTLPFVAPGTTQTLGRAPLLGEHTEEILGR
ncbi:MAG: CoA transferase [SAR202 cluster bacterium]|jgi:crotonobetainyl-CoA:carnitine CoA-transferase CaiB-like acyl-CoA transferase|nr:CoA transferase [SAR202 cluster bacterium]|tara:strand:+ start:3260 stop:4453 length:1194 start_codon:yes stop_codon:yes gene_type:complete